MIRRSLLPVVTSLVFAVSSQGQTVVERFEPPIAGGGYGAAVRTMGDLTGDGLPEVAIGQVDELAQVAVGAVYLYRGGDGALLMTFNEPLVQSHYGTAVGRIDDVDGDGLPELLIGAPGAPENSVTSPFVEIRSGATGTLIRSTVGLAGSSFGAAVLGLNDVNADGTSDYAVGAPSDSTALQGAGAVYVYSGSTGLLLHSVQGTTIEGQMGKSLALLPDQTGDGASEFLVGSPGLNLATILSGSSGALVQSFPGPTGARSFGFSVGAMDDLDGDGLAEVLVGSPEQPGNSGPAHGAVHIYSNSTGLILREHPGGFAGDYYGYSLTGTDDIDGDGTGDYLIGAPLLNSSSFFPAGFIQVRSGATGDYMTSWSGGSLGAQFGYAVDDLGDYNGDGLHDVLGGAPGRDFALVVQAEEVIGESYCFGDGSGATCPCGNNNDGSTNGGLAGCANGENLGGGALLATGSSSVAASSLQLVAQGLDPGAPGLYFQGTSRVNNFLGDGFLCAGGGIIRMEIVTASPQGTSQTSIEVEQVGGVQAGDVRDYQLWYRNPGTSPCNSGFNLTNGVEIQWVP